MNLQVNFLYCLIAFGAGIFAEFFSPLGSTFNGIIIAALLPIYLLSISKKIGAHVRLAVCMIASYITGQAILSLHIEILRQSQQSLAGKYGYVIGIVQEIDALTHIHYKQKLIINLEAAKEQESGCNKKLSHKIALYSKINTKAAVGDKILVKNISIKPPPLKLTVANITLLRNGCIATTFITHPYQYKVLDHPSASWQRTLWEWREKNYRGILNKLSSLTAPYIGLLFFGNKQHEATDNLQTIFSYWGLSHFLARSGLHIVLLVGLWIFMLQFIPIHLSVKNCFLLGAITLYAILSWESTSFLRALFVFFLARIGKLYNKEIPTLYTLTVICMLMLLYNPLLIFYLDFQLTFWLTFGLLGFSRYLHTETKNT